MMFPKGSNPQYKESSELRLLSPNTQNCPGSISCGPHVTCPLSGAMRPPNAGYVRLAANACELKRHRRPPKLIADGHCRRACDLLFMQDLELSHREMGYVLNIPKSSAFERLNDCEALLP